MLFRLIPLMLSAFMLLGCSSKTPGLFDFLRIDDFSGQRVELEHLGEPVQAPSIPQDLLDAASQISGAPRAVQNTLRYDLDFEFRGGEPEVPLRDDIIGAFTGASMLEKLRAGAPTDAAGLELRMRSDLDVAREVLRAYGFYTGDASGHIGFAASGGNDAPARAVVTVVFSPGERYHLGRSSIEANIDAEEPEGDRRASLPRSLDDLGLPEGSPVVADAILAAVDSVPSLFRRRGYPFAEVKSARYFLDHDKRALETEILVDAGEKVRVGDLELRGALPVRPEYFEALQNWRAGRLWNQNVIDRYRERLRQTGLFASLNVYPSETRNSRGERNVVVEAVGALERTIGGALRYDSDLGFGLLAYRENRNFTDRGDLLRFELPVWQEKQEVAGMYRLPFFLRPGQDLLINGGVFSEDTDYYKLLTASGSMGVERRLGRYWRGTARVSGEGGNIEETGEEKRRYYMMGLPLSLAFNNTPRLLDASGGMRLALGASPYGGYYDDYFSALRTRVDASVFWPVVGEDAMVLALRGVYGSLFGAGGGEVPPTIRFYSGGGGSVRGYDFRSIGPRNANNDPLGGGSLIECSAELRWRFSEAWGLVLFSDGGMVYTDNIPSESAGLLWGAGMGLRYYTALGPVRFDVAFPLNRRGSDSSMQLYISIGQSF